MALLSISHLRQSQESDCLAACAQIVLQYLQIPILYARLLRILETEQAGSYFSKLKKLETALGLSVELAQGTDDLDRFYNYLNQARFCEYWGVKKLLDGCYFSCRGCDWPG